MIGLNALPKAQGDALLRVLLRHLSDPTDKVRPAGMVAALGKNPAIMARMAVAYVDASRARSARI
jgi:hypothetical protein